MLICLKAFVAYCCLLDIYEQKLLHEVEQTQQALLKFNNVFSLRCKKLAEVIRDPWGNPILYRLLNTADAAIGPEGFILIVLYVLLLQCVCAFF